VEVRSIFYNLPVRRKFLRSENTESRNIEHQLHLQAIGHPEIAFAFVRDDRIVFQLPAAANLLERIRDLYGSDLVERLLPVREPSSSRRIRIRGLIGQAGVSRQSRDQQLVFVNGRAVENPVVGAALKEGYHTALMKGQFPVTFLFIELPPAEVDVNVHPAKREVRFRDPAGVREAVVGAIRRTLESDRSSWQEQFRGPTIPEVPFVRRTEAMMPSNNVAQPNFPVEMPGLAATDDRFSPNEERRPVGEYQFRILGILNKLYVLMENEEGLVLVDQHAAHERILFEELRRRMEEKGVPSQRLLLPQVIELAPRDAEWIERNLPTLQKMGLGVEEFGRHTFKLESLPPFLSGVEPDRLLQDVIDSLKSSSNSSSPLRLGEEMIAKTVCRHAVKANDLLRQPEVEKLIRDLLECELPYCCPHGRPTAVVFSRRDLDKLFKRVVSG
jgi:DNA mismatch repair protein MutL